MTTDNSDKDRALSEIRSDIESTRERLAETLDAIEERLDVSKRFKGYVAEGRDRAGTLYADGRDRFETLRQDNPVLLYSVLGGVGAAVRRTGVAGGADSVGCSSTNSAANASAPGKTQPLCTLNKRSSGSLPVSASVRAAGAAPKASRTRCNMRESSRARRRVISKESLSLTAMTSSGMAGS